jgi:flagellar motor switch protein FliM
VTIEAYSFSEAERIRYGRYPVLDTVLYRWARKIEETLFEHFRIELYAGSSVADEMKFSTFYGSLKAPRPIYLFELEPFRGQALFVLDNRFANLCLNPGLAGEGVQRLSPENHERLQRVVQQMMSDFEQSWANVLEVKAHLKKVTTYLFRARILNPYEPCLVAQIHLSGAEASSRLTWCFPRIMLESALQRLGPQRVVPSPYAERIPDAQVDSDQLLDQTAYQVRVDLGSLDYRKARHGLRVGTVLPLVSEVGAEAIIKVNGAPLLVGNVGEIQGRYAVKVTGTYAKRRQALLQDSTAFRPIHWPETSM